MANKICVSESVNPYENLALEELLFDTAGEDRILYLWRNADTVVLGRNQNAWGECRVREIEEDGVFLARRKTGGGAVFHDLGNLNFTFIAAENAYDLPRQLRVIAAACASFGVETEATGRNDIVLKQSGQKFSGNAFRSAHGTKLHHGTILIDTDGARMAKYLTPSPEKLKARGVESVRARVANLAAFAPGITAEGMMAALKRAFAAEFGEAEPLSIPADDAHLAALTAFYASWNWRVGASPGCDLRYAHRFPWGGAELLLTVQGGRIASASVYSDALDADAIESIAPALLGEKARAEALAGRLRQLGNALADDIAAYLLQTHTEGE